MKERGATIVTADAYIHVPVEQVIKKPVDVTGAGDSWLAAFLYAYTQGFSLEESGRLANAYASKVLMHFGARASHEDARQVLSEVLGTEK